MSVSVGVVVDDPRWRHAIKDPGRACRRAAAAAVAGASDGALPVELCVRLADDYAVADLNRRFRGKRGPTNVLSFPLQEPNELFAASETSGTVMLGDVVLAYETVAREAKRDGKAFPDHVAHLVVHGVLHLFGLDHANAEEAAEMEALEVQVLARLGVDDPYARGDSVSKRRVPPA